MPLNVNGIRMSLPVGEVTEIPKEFLPALSDAMSVDFEVMEPPAEPKAPAKKAAATPRKKKAAAKKK